MPDNFAPNFTATGIGTLPHTDPDAAVADITGRLKDMPYWPQLPKLGPLEDMNLQYARALAPLVAADQANRSLAAHPGLGREEALAALYERLFGPDQASFAPAPEEAAGYFRFREAVRAAPQGAFPWVKGHVTGPLTFLASVIGGDGKAMLYDDEAAEAVARGLGAAAGAQARQLAELGRPVMIFFDEPFLSGYGSAFTPLGRDKVVGLLSASLEEARSRAELVTGIHCCGNTEWSLLVEAGADVLNLDSHGFGKHLLLYPEALAQLYDRGGAVAWGAVPTVDYNGRETAEELWTGLRGLLEALAARGFDRDVLGRQSLVTPACGMGGLPLASALAILDLTAEVSRLARERWS